jgi:hypothetical protein
MGNKWGFLKETEEKAEKDGIDKEDTGMHSTGLKE